MTAPVQVSRIGPQGAFGMYLTAAATALTGPLLVAAGHFVGLGLTITGIVFTVLLVPVAFVISLTVAAERRHNRHLDAIGLPATAEVVDLIEWDTGDDAGIEIDLRFTGTGFDPFDATWKRSPHPALRPGLRLDAVVDPANRMYRVDL